MASKRRIRRRSCKGKIRHTDVEKAHKHAKGLGWPNHPYKCKFCNGYHVGRHSVKNLKALAARKKRMGSGVPVYPRR